MPGRGAAGAPLVSAPCEARASGGRRPTSPKGQEKPASQCETQRDRVFRCEHTLRRATRPQQVSAIRSVARRTAAWHLASRRVPMLLAAAERARRANPPGPNLGLQPPAASHSRVACLTRAFPPRPPSRSQPLQRSGREAPFSSRGGHASRQEDQPWRS